MLIAREHSMLLVVDMQTRLLPTIAEAQAVVDRVSWLVRAARQLSVPVQATEQYPQGLGPTDPTIAALLPESPIVGKLEFSCAAGRCFEGRAAPERQQIVIVGIEAHVCVLQTAIELRGQGRDVFLVADAVGSRSPNDKHLAIERLRHGGVHIVSAEMVAFEWLRRAGSDEFRAFSKAFLRA